MELGREGERGQGGRDGKKEREKEGREDDGVGKGGGVISMDLLGF